MKRQAFFILLFFVFIPQVFAENITTGNASATSNVETNIEGGGSVTTHIEVEANGEKKVFDSDKPGTYKVEVKSDGSSSSVQTSTGSGPSATPQASPTAKIQEKIENATKKQESIGLFVKNIFKNIFDRFKELFRL